YKKRRFGDAGGRECCEAIIAGGAEVAVFTLGAKGCIGMYEGGYFEAPTYDVEVKDTTGCGDVFHGAFVHGLIRGWDVPFIARFANAVASIKCTRLGGRAGIPDEATAMRFMETGVIDYAEIDERVEFYRRVR
ncbi:MAG: PfkB family carbohydrate kinase, partial [Oscillospiraceae bacterium]|nr:PfkB family carbohydrate kinase [Oscillospiraceae bacterium]